MVPRAAVQEEIDRRLPVFESGKYLVAFGGGVFTASHEGRKVEALGDEAIRQCGTLPEEKERMRSLEKRKPLRADVDVRRAGNAWRIDAIRSTGQSREEFIDGHPWGSSRRGGAEAGAGGCLRMSSEDVQ